MKTIQTSKIWPVENMSGSLYTHTHTNILQQKVTNGVNILENVANWKITVNIKPA